jgi:hypothetical protein
MASELETEAELIVWAERLRQRPHLVSTTIGTESGVSFQEAVECNRERAMRLTPELRRDVLIELSYIESDFIDRFLRTEPSGEDIDEAVERINRTVPNPIDEIVHSVGSGSVKALADDVRVLVAELLELRERVAALEAERDN